MNTNRLGSLLALALLIYMVGSPKFSADDWRVLVAIGAWGGVTGFWFRYAWGSRA